MSKELEKIIDQLDLGSAPCEYCDVRLESMDEQQIRGVNNKIEDAIS